MKAADKPASSDAFIQDVMREAETAERSDPFAKLGRRGFLKLTGVAGGGLALAFYLGSNSKSAGAEPDSSGDAALNAYVRVAPNGDVIVYSKGPEIGQGIKTAFALIIAEELDADWAHVRVEQASVNSKLYGNQGAGGSRSIPTNWDVLRQAGATARAMLVSAAAKNWNVAESECTTDKSAVLHGASKKRATYASLATAAAKLPVPDVKTVALKERKNYKLIGKSYTGVDNLKVVTGQPLFGIDQAPPGMLYASYTKCPAVGGKVAQANLDHIKTLPGVKDAFVVEGNGKPAEVMPGVAIIATSTWAAFSAKRALQITWDESAASKDSTSAAATKAQAIAHDPGQQIVFANGDVNGAFGTSARTVEAFYEYPFLSHAPLEPQNTTAWYKDGAIEMWAPTQNATSGRTLVAGVLGVPEEKVTVHQTRVGGGFGRRLVTDYMCEAAAIAKNVGAPVKLQWTREDDMAHDFYRVAGFHAFKGAVDKSGKLSAWQDHFITFSADGKNPVAGGNIPVDEFPANVLTNVNITQTMQPLMIPCGAWRAPRSNGIAFAVQSFIHEMALAAGRDHRDFLIEIMGEPRWLKPDDQASLNTGRAIGVIKLAAEKAGWGRKLPAGRGLGLAFHFSHLGHVAEVAEVSVDAKKKLTVHKITVAADIGPVINMSGALNQCQGAALDGLSTMMGLALTIENGRIKESNFGEYQPLRMPSAPPVEAFFIQSDFRPTGLGEPALPPVAAAVCNAIYAATGERVRKLPLTKSGYSI